MKRKMAWWFYGSCALAVGLAASAEALAKPTKQEIKNEVAAGWARPFDEAALKRLMPLLKYRGWCNNNGSGVKNKAITECAIGKWNGRAALFTLYSHKNGWFVANCSTVGNEIWLTGEWWQDSGCWGKVTVRPSFTYKGATITGPEIDPGKWLFSGDHGYMYYVYDRTTLAFKRGWAVDNGDGDGGVKPNWLATDPAFRWLP